MKKEIIEQGAKIACERMMQLADPNGSHKWDDQSHAVHKDWQDTIGCVADLWHMDELYELLLGYLSLLEDQSIGDEPYIEEIVPGLPLGYPPTNAQRIRQILGIPADRRQT